MYSRSLLSACFAADPESTWKLEKEIGMETEKNSAEIGYMKRLSRPVGPVDVVLDTDAYNEIDDLYALAIYDPVK